MCSNTLRKVSHLDLGDLRGEENMADYMQGRVI